MGKPSDATDHDGEFCARKPAGQVHPPGGISGGAARGGRGLGALTALALQGWLPFFGVSCLVIVLLTHVAERLHMFPNMGWGLPNSPGHYLDLISAIVVLTLINPVVRAEPFDRA